MGSALGTTLGSAASTTAVAGGYLTLAVNNLYSSIYASSLLTLGQVGSAPLNQLSGIIQAKALQISVGTGSTTLSTTNGTSPFSIVSASCSSLTINNVGSVNLGNYNDSNYIQISTNLTVNTSPDSLGNGSINITKPISVGQQLSLTANASGSGAGGIHQLNSLSQADLSGSVVLTASGSSTAPGALDISACVQSGALSQRMRPEMSASLFRRQYDTGELFSRRRQYF